MDFHELNLAKDLGLAGVLAATLTDEASLERYRRSSVLLWVCQHSKLSVAFSIAAYFAVVGFTAPGAMTITADVDLKHIIFLMVLYTVAFTFFGLWRCLSRAGKSRKELLAKINVSQCQRALAILTQSQLAVRWRDSVVAEARALRVFDLVVMEKLARVEKETADASYEEKLCREVHGLSA
jgi:hypothetical protein